MIARSVAIEQISRTLDETGFEALGRLYKGKVRDNYTKGDRRVIITTDRISAFDRVLGTIPFKGQVLTQLARFWFEKTEGIVPNHVLDYPDPNVMVVKECSALPVEMVVRGYITGVTTTSAWYNYSRGVRDFCGNRLAEGLRKDQRLDKPIITPTTKAELGEHDQNISPDEIIKKGLLTKAEWDQLARMSLALFELGTRIAAEQGIILVDTKYEFGKDKDGNIVLIDEIHTPDSSRFWYKDTYEELFAKASEQRKIDKEYVRAWYAEQGYTGEGTPPELTVPVRAEAALRYIEAYEKITGAAFEAIPGDVRERIKANLRKGGYL